MEIGLDLIDFTFKTELSPLSRVAQNGDRIRR
jgi:hypothetical protein